MRNLGRGGGIPSSLIYLKDTASAGGEKRKGQVGLQHQHCKERYMDIVEVHHLGRRALEGGYELVKSICHE